MQQARLSAVPFFSGVTKQDLAVVAQQTDEVDVAAGEVWRARATSATRSTSSRRARPR